MVKILVFAFLFSGVANAMDRGWSFGTLVRVMERKGLTRWQRGNKQFMKGLRFAKAKGYDVTETGVMESMVLKNGGFYFTEDPGYLNFESMPRKFF